MHITYLSARFGGLVRHRADAARASGARKATGWERVKADVQQIRASAAAERLRLNQHIQALTPLASRVRDLQAHLEDQRAGLQRAEQDLEDLRTEKQQLALRHQRQVQSLTQALQELRASYDAELEAHRNTRALARQRLEWLGDPPRHRKPGQPAGPLADLAAEFRARGSKKA